MKPPVLISVLYNMTRTHSVSYSVGYTNGYKNTA